LDARSEFGASSLRSELDLPRVDSAMLGAVEAMPAQAPPSFEGASAGAMPATALPVLTTSAQGAAPEGEGLPALGGGDAALMTPRTRARMDPMGDIVRMIETGSARKGPRPPNLPAGARGITPVVATIYTLATTETPASAEGDGTNLGAAFDMEVGSKLPAAQQPPAAAQADPIEGTFQPADAGQADGVIEPQQQHAAVSTEAAGASDQATGAQEDTRGEPMQLAAESGAAPAAEQPGAAGGVVTGVATAVGVAAGAVAGVAGVAVSAVSAFMGSKPAQSSPDPTSADRSLDPESEDKSLDPEPSAAAQSPPVAGFEPAPPGGSATMSAATDTTEAQAAVPSFTQQPPAPANAGMEEDAAEPLGLGVHSAAMDAIKEPAGAEFLPPASTGMAEDVTEPPPPPVAAGVAEDATDSQLAALAHAEQLDAITDPAGAEFLPPAAAGIVEDVAEPSPPPPLVAPAGTAEDVAEPQQAAPAHAEPLDAITEPAGAEFLPPAVTGQADDVVETLATAEGETTDEIAQPAGAEFLPPAAAGPADDVTEPQTLALPAEAEATDVITEPAGSKVLPPAAAGHADDVIEPQTLAPPAEAETTDEVTEPAGAEFLPPAVAGQAGNVVEPQPLAPAGADTTNEFTGQAGVEGLPTATAGQADDVIELQPLAPAEADKTTEPASAQFLPPAVAGQADDVTEPQTLAPADADMTEETTEPVGVEHLPSAVAETTKGVMEPRQPPPESAGTDGTDEQAAGTREDWQGAPPQPAAAPDASETEPSLAGDVVLGLAALAGGAAGAAAGVAIAAASAVSRLVTSPGPAEPRGTAPPSAGPPPGPDGDTGEAAAETEPADPEAVTAPSSNSVTATRAVSFAPLPTEAAAGVEPDGPGEGRPTGQQPLPADADAVEAKDDLAAAGLPPGPPPIATPPPQEAIPVASPPRSAFSPTDSSQTTESLASGADVADAELLMLQRAKTREGDAAGSATELPMAPPPLPSVPAASPPADASPPATSETELPPSKTATARAALLGTGLTDDALPGAVTVGGVAAAIGAANASVGGKYAEAAPEEGEPAWHVVACGLTSLEETRRLLSAIPNGHVACLGLCWPHDTLAFRNTCDWSVLPAVFPQIAALLTPNSVHIIRLFPYACADPVAPASASDAKINASAATGGPAPEIEGTLNSIGVTDDALPGDVKVIARRTALHRCDNRSVVVSSGLECGIMMLTFFGCQLTEPQLGNPEGSLSGPASVAKS